jgi:hypothetical protein
MPHRREELPPKAGKVLIDERGSRCPRSAIRRRTNGETARTDVMSVFSCAIAVTAVLVVGVLVAQSGTVVASEVTRVMMFGLHDSMRTVVIEVGRPAHGGPAIGVAEAVS